MAISINIYYTGKNGSAKQFAREMVQSGTVDAIRAEKGNLKYEYFFSTEDEETVLLIDIWESQEALDIHHATVMMDTIMQLREKHGLTMKVERYISDENGIPKHDQRFIKQRE